ncbi:nucleoside hydrolase [Rothia nasimurium]|uniref:nucleoside hydrolase n=1 Tax=Rothia nasimurium TaxID=85336 RepID=UPI001F399670|nr:nucleoside hydrolase [Rothia nasimurium]
MLIDCDPGIDDTLALTYAYTHPQVAVEGIVATGGNVSTEQVGRNVRGLLELLDGQGTPGPSELRTPWPNHSPPPKKPPDPWAQATGRCPGRAGPPRHPARRRPTRRLRGETPPGPAPHRTTPACPSRSTRHLPLHHYQLDTSQ